MPIDVAADVEAIFENGDFNVPAVFVIDPDTSPDSDLTVQGYFTAASQAVPIGGFAGLEVEAAKPSFTCPTSKVTAVENKMRVLIDSLMYQVEKKEPTGVGTSVVWLKVLKGSCG